MVLRIKEREEAIQLLAMDPQVLGKLVTLHRRGNGVDVEALRDRIPLRQDAGKAPRWGLTGTEGCGGGKVFSWLSWQVFGIFENIQAEEIGRWSHEGPTRVGGTPYPTGRALRPCGHLMASLTCTPSPLDVFQSKKNHHERFIPFGLCLIFLFCETLKQGKNRN